MINNDHNKSCSYAEQLVSFLYNEISDSEKPVFEAHLRNCSLCAEEIAAFSSVRFSIQDWRAEEFASLSTPTFEIPFAENNKDASIGWLESIRAFLSFPPAWVSATAVAAVLVIVGLFWFASKSPEHQEIASNKEEKVINSNSSIAEYPAKNESLASVDKDKDEVNDYPEKKDVQIKSVTEKVELKLSKTGNIKAQPIKVKSSSPVIIERKNEKPSVKTVNKKEIPSFAVDEDEETNLRLSDILEEVSMR